MGLDSFISDGSSSSNSSSSSSGSTGRGSGTVDHGEAHNAHKIIWNGDNSLPIEENEVVIQTKEDWEDIVEFIEKNMGLSIEEFESKPKDRQHEIAKKAKDVVQENKREVFGEHQTCDVCGSNFVFPEDWNYKEIEGFYSCPDHTIDEFMSEFREHENEM